MLVAAVAGLRHRRGTPAATRSRFLAGAAAGACLSVVFGVLVLWLNSESSRDRARAEPLRVGAVGLRRGSATRRSTLGERSHFAIPFLANDAVPRARPSSRHHPMVYLAVALAAAHELVSLPLARGAGPPRRRRVAGVGARARLLRCGSSASWPWSAAARCAAVAGAYSSVVYTRLWVEGMIAGQRLDRARADQLRDLAAGARAARRVPLRRHDDAAAPPAGRGRRGPEPAPHGAPVPRDDRRARGHLAELRVDARRHAGLPREAVLPRFVTRASLSPPLSLGALAMNIPPREVDFWLGLAALASRSRVQQEPDAPRPRRRRRPHRPLPRRRPRPPSPRAR